MARENARKRLARKFGQPPLIADAIGMPTAAVVGCQYESQPTRDEIQQIRQSCEHTLAQIRQAKVVVIDNVAEYLFAGTGQEKWDFKRDFPAARPPFDLMFLEFKRPSSILNGEMRGSAKHMPPRIGALIESVPAESLVHTLPSEADKRKILDEIERTADYWWDRADVAAVGAALQQQDFFAAIRQMPAAERNLAELILKYRMVDKMRPGDSINGDALNGIACSLRATVVPLHDNGDWGVLGVMRFLVADDGTLDDTPQCAIPLGHHLKVEDLYAVRTSICCALYPVMLAISFMNCKNVTLPYEEPDRELNRVRKKAGLRPFVRYNTINIEPMKAAIRAARGMESLGIKKAMHIVRGHFARYSEERPLFGRPGLSGSFWMPAHVRGSIKQGVVQSDYEIASPKD